MCAQNNNTACFMKRSDDHSQLNEVRPILAHVCRNHAVVLWLYDVNRIGVIDQEIVCVIAPGRMPLTVCDSERGLVVLPDLEHLTPDRSCVVVAVEPVSMIRSVADDVLMEPRHELCPRWRAHFHIRYPDVYIRELLLQDLQDVLP